MKKFLVLILFIILGVIAFSLIKSKNPGLVNGIIDSATEIFDEISNVFDLNPIEKRTYFQKRVNEIDQIIHEQRKFITSRESKGEIINYEEEKEFLEQMYTYKNTFEKIENEIQNLYIKEKNDELNKIIDTAEKLSPDFFKDQDLDYSDYEQAAFAFREGFPEWFYDIPEIITNVFWDISALKGESCEIYLDGKRIPYRDRIEFTQTGSHELIVINRDYRNFSEKIDIDDKMLCLNEVLKLDYNPVRLTGNLNILTAREGISSFKIDGKAYPIAQITRLYTGTHLIEIEKEGYQKYEKTVEIIADETYNLEPEFSKNKINRTFVSNVEKAEVYLDDVFIGNVPVEIAIDDKTCRVTMKKDGYLEKTVQINPAESDHTIELTLIRQTGSLKISDPEIERIQIFINDSPFSYESLSELYVGLYKITLIKQGYELFEKKITIKADEEYVLYPDFKKIIYVRKIITNVDKCSIYKDNLFSGYTPLVLQLEDKNYQLRVEKDGYKTKSLTLNPRNQSEIININLEPDAFTLTINSDSDAKVYINNTFTGYASFSKKLQPGTYKIKCLYDSEQYEKEITLKKDMTLTFNFNSELSEQSFKMKSCVNVICLSERNKFAIADSEGVQIFNARGKVINNLSTDSEIKSMIFSDEDRLLIGSMDGVVSEYNFKTGVLQDLFSLDGWILDIEANAKGYIAASSRNGEVIVYDASTKRQLYKYDGNKFYSILQLEMAENGEVFFSTTEKKLYASDLTNEREIYTGTGIIKSMTLENDTLFTSDTNGCLMACTYDFTKMTVLNKIKKTMDNSNYIYIQRLNNHLITVDETGNLRLFDDELNLIKAFKDNPEIQCMQFIQTDEQPFMLYALTNNVYIKKFSSY